MNPSLRPFSLTALSAALVLCAAVVALAPPVAEAPPAAPAAPEQIVVIGEFRGFASRDDGYAEPRCAGRGVQRRVTAAVHRER